MTKKVLVVFTILLIFNVYNIYAINTKDYLKIQVPAAVVIDDNTHRILFDKNAHEQRNIASLTKVMTSIMLVEHCELNEVIEVPSQATWIGGSELGLKLNDKITAYNLLVGMLLPSR